MKNTTIPVLHIDTFKPVHYEDIYVNDFKSHLKRFSNHISSPHNHDFYLVVLFTKGVGKHHIDFKTYDIQPGSIFFLKPGQTHNWTFDDNIDGYIFFHTKQFYNWSFPTREVNSYPFYSTLYNHPEITLDKKSISQIEKRFKNMLVEFGQNNRYKFEKLANQIDSIYIDASRLHEALPANSGEISIDLKRTEEFEKLVQLNFKNNNKMDFYSNKLSVSTRQLNRSLMKALGKSATDIIHEKLIHEANLLLYYTEKPIKEIGFELSFYDASHFIKFYKNKTGVSPKEFRAERKT